MIQSVVSQSQVITHIWPAKRSIKTARCNESPALQHGQCSGALRAYLTRQRISLKVGHDLNNKPIRKFHCPCLLDETVKLERTSAFRIVLRPRPKPCALKHAKLFFFGQRSSKTQAARTSRETASGRRLFVNRGRSGNDEAERLPVCGLWRACTKGLQGSNLGFRYV